MGKWKEKIGLLLAAVLLAGSLDMGFAVRAENADGGDGEKTAAEIVLQDAEFTGNLWDDGIWTVSPSAWDGASFQYFTYVDDQYMETGEHQGESGFKFYLENSGSFTLLQTVAQVPAGSYTVDADFMGDKADVQLVIGSVESPAHPMEGWNVWTEVSDTLTVEEDLTDVSVGFKVTVAAGGWGYLDSMSITRQQSTVSGGDGGSVSGSDAQPVDAEIYVPRVKNLSDDFIGGADVSSYLVLKNSGVKFYDFDGQELDGQGFFNLLASSGMNYVRLRVWNDPFTSDGKGYGGGNNNLDAAVQMGQWATEAGMKVLIDFHYSDFWADPGRQYAPKAWQGYTIEQKAAAVESFTSDSLKTLLDAGVDVGMVQVGNETNSQICGEDIWADQCAIFKAGSRAVRNVSSERGKEILVALHFTEPQDSGRYSGIAKKLADNGVDYDVFASSYYPYWHGTTSNLKSVLGSIANTYGKKVMVAETSWSYTLRDGDGCANTIKKDSDGISAYPISVQGQATALYNVIKTMSETDGGIGVFYWEPAWLPVHVYDEDAENAAEILEQNKTSWLEQGTGWASDYAEDYDAVVKQWRGGGSVIDNQAFFDFYGHPLATLNIFNYVKTGTTAPVSFDYISDVEVTVENGTQIILPQKVTAIFTDGSKQEVNVVWDSGKLAEAAAAGVGTYEIKGTADVDGSGKDVYCTLTIKPVNLLLNPSFELADMDMWKTTEGKVDRQNKAADAMSGDYSLHFYDGSQAVNYTVEQTVTLNAGIYTFGGFLQGGDAGDDAVFRLTAKYGQETKSAEASVKGWKVWAEPIVENILITTDNTEVVLSIHGEAQKGAWGTWDDMYLYRMGDTPITPTPTPEVPTPTPTVPAPTPEVPTPTPTPTVNEEKVSAAIQELNQLKNETDTKKAIETVKKVLSDLKDAISGDTNVKKEAVANAVLNSQTVLTELENKLIADNGGRKVTVDSTAIRDSAPVVEILNTEFNVSSGQEGKIIITNAVNTKPADLNIGSVAVFHFSMMVRESSESEWKMQSSVAFDVPMYITMDVPKEIDTSNGITVFHIEDGSNVWEAQGDGILSEDGKKVSFTASSFSSYAIASKAGSTISTPEPEDNDDDNNDSDTSHEGRKTASPKTGDYMNNAAAAMIIVLAMAVIGMALVVKRRKESE